MPQTPQLPVTFRRPNLPIGCLFVRVAGGRPCIHPQLLPRLRRELEPAGWRDARVHNRHEVLRLWRPNTGQLVIRYGSPHLTLSTSLLVVEVGGRRAAELERELLALCRTLPEVDTVRYLTTADGRIWAAETAPCPWCGRAHRHGASAEGAGGPRQSHCSPGGEYFVIDNYPALAAARRAALRGAK